MNAAANQQTVVAHPAGDTWRMVRTLGGVSLLSGCLIVITYQLTLPRIVANRQQLVEEAIFQVLPGATSRVTYAVESGGMKRVDGLPGPGAKMYAGYDDSGHLVGVAIEAAGQGYQDIIRVLYGYAPDRGCTTGFTVLESKETPGLGDKIAKDERFLANFNGLELKLDESQSTLRHDVVTVKQGTKSNPWEIDGISGATISSKAVGRIINDSGKRIVPLIQKNLDQIRGRQ
ncbi:MAG: electron transport complex subunit G [Candidatus Hydrogenedentota bacterium]